MANCKLQNSNCQFAIRNLQFDISRSHTVRSFIAAVWLLALAGCHSDMYDQPRYEPLEKSDFFDDGRASRPLVAGTVAQGDLREDEALYTAREDGKLIADLPQSLRRELASDKDNQQIDPAFVQRGQERFNIFCTPCHGQLGEGDGMIVRRGFRQPPTYHSDRLRGVPIGHFFDVMTNGFATMPDYAEMIPVRDRWAIAVYVRALQWSQNARPDDLDEASRRRLEAKSEP